MTKPLPSNLGKLILMLGSSHDGEVLAAVNAIRRALATAGMDLHDLVNAIAAPAPNRAQRPPQAKQPPKPKAKRAAASTTPRPEPKKPQRVDVGWAKGKPATDYTHAQMTEMVRILGRDASDFLTVRANNFVETMFGAMWASGASPTPPQARWIVEMYSKHIMKDSV